MSPPGGSRRIVLHIGTMKSATTYLQRLCSDNRRLLAEHDVLWPTTHRYRPFRDLFGQGLEGADIGGSWPALRAEIAAHDGVTVVSNEMLAGLPAARIAKLVRELPAADVELVITVRDLARVIPSQWYTAVQNGNIHGLAEYAASVCRDEPTTAVEHVAPNTSSAIPTALPPATPTGPAQPSGLVNVGEPGLTTSAPETPSTSRFVDRFTPAVVFDRFWRTHDVPDIIERWGQHVPVEHMTVVTVPSSNGDPTEVARRFGGVFGVDLAALPQPPLDNRSVGAHSAELLRRLGLRLQDLSQTERDEAFREGLSVQALAVLAPSQPPFALSPEQQRWTIDRSRRMIEQLRASRVRIVGDLEDLLPAAEPPETAVDPALTTDLELLDAAMGGLEQLVRVLARVRRQARRRTVAKQAGHGQL